MTKSQMTAAANQLINNPAALAFARQEALEKVASEIRERRGSGTTAKAVEVLELRHENIRLRVLQYTAAGLVGVAMAMNS